MTKAAAVVAFATPFADESLSCDLTRQVAIRQRCCYCAVKHMTDGLGPVLAGQLVSDGACELAFARMMAELDAREAAR